MHFIAIYPWLIATGILVNAKYPTGAREDNKTVPMGNNPELIFFKPNSVIFLSALIRTGLVAEERSFGVVQAIFSIVPKTFFFR